MKSNDPRLKSCFKTIPHFYAALSTNKSCYLINKNDPLLLMVSPRSQVAVNV